MSVAYLDAVGGLAGDMWLAALLDAGLEVKELEKILDPLPGNPSLEIKRITRKGLSALNLRVLPRSSGPFPTRFLEIKAFLQGLDLPSYLKEKVEEAFASLFHAEAKVHGTSLEKVYLHELASYDTLAEIIGVIFGVEQLGLEEIWIGSLPLGTGIIEGDHGPIPLPAQATMELLKGYEVYGLKEKAETITPTGALLLRVLKVRQGPLPLMRIRKIGVGAGSRSLESRPNVLRIFLGERRASRDNFYWELVIELEADLDDQSPEILSHAAEKLRQAGALDVGFIPFFMKKGRPGVKIKVLVQPELAQDLAKILLQETGSLGVRVRETKRLLIPRENRKIKTPWGMVRVKVARAQDNIRYKPEFEDVRSLAERHSLPLPALYQKILAYLEGLFAPTFPGIPDKDREPLNKSS